MDTFSCTGADVIDFAVSVPSEIDNEVNTERVSSSYRVERRYSEFASFKKLIDQVGPSLVRHSVRSCSTTLHNYLTAHLSRDLTQSVADCRQRVLQCYAQRWLLCLRSHRNPSWQLMRRQWRIGSRRCNYGFKRCAPPPFRPSTDASFGSQST